MKGLFYLDTFSISDHHSPENFHSREAIDIGVVRSFLQPTFLPRGEYIMSIWAKYSLCIPDILEEYDGRGSL